MFLTARQPFIACLGVFLPLVTFAEDQDAYVLDAVTVQAQPGPTAQGKVDLEREQALTPGGVTLLEAEDLTERNVGSIGDMLRYGQIRVWGGIGWVGISLGSEPRICGCGKARRRARATSATAS